MPKITVKTSTKKYSASLIVGAILFLVALWFLLSWLVMNALSIIHDDWAAVPALGFAASLQVIILTYVLGGLWHLASSD